MAAWFGLITLTITALATGTPAWGRQLQGTAKAPLQTHAPTATAATPLGPTASQRALDSVYVRLLERTNQQLSLWWNPYGIMVAALGALFAVLAIVAAFIIFRQSREYRSLITRSIAEYQGILNAFIEEKNREIGVIATGVTKDIERATKELTTATGEQKAQIETEIAELKKYKESLRPYEQPKFMTPGLEYSTVSIPMNFPMNIPINTSFSALSFPTTVSVNPTRSHTCAKCRKNYEVSSRPLGLLEFGGRDVTCPHCGTTERITA